MLIKPTNTIDWDAPSTKVIEPDSFKKVNAWNVNEKPPVQYLNWFWNMTSNWSKFFAENTGCYSQTLTLTSGSYVMSDDDNIGIVLFYVGGPVSLTLPIIANNNNRILIVKNVATSATATDITINPNAADTIDGESSYEIPDVEGAGIILVADNVGNWEILFDSLSAQDASNTEFGNREDLTTETEIKKDSLIEINRLISTLIKDVWSSTGDLVIARRYLAGVGTQNSALSFGGNSITDITSNHTEKFNGITWSSTNNLQTGRASLAGAGTQNSALSFGGDVSPFNQTEKFIINTWSNTGTLSPGRRSLAGCGTQNSALAVGGHDYSVYSDDTEKFNGLTWSNTGNLVVARASLVGVGTQNSALSFGGYGGTTIVYNNTEKFNGIAWSNTGTLSTGRFDLAGSGTQNSALAFGGRHSTTAKYYIVEKFNGLTWNVVTQLIIEKSDLAAAGTQNSALSFGGYDGTDRLNTTEKFTGELQFDILSTFIGDDSLKFQTKNNSFILTEPGTLVIDIDTKSTITDLENRDLEILSRLIYDNYTWTATTPMNVLRYALAGCGTQNAALSFGGYSSASLDTTEKFNGTTNAWTTITSSLLSARDYLAGAGTQNSALSFGGKNITPSTITQSFNGVIWSAVGGTTLIGRYYLAGCGTQNSALSFGGNNIPYKLTQKFNGSIWASTGDLNEGLVSASGCGTQNSALALGDYDRTEKFNGSTWSAAADYNKDRHFSAVSGVQNNALAFGGSASPYNQTEKFNGLAWTIMADLNTPREALAGAGTANSALSFGGLRSSVLNVAEKFNNNFGTVYQEVTEKILII